MSARALGKNVSARSQRARQASLSCPGEPPGPFDVKRSDAWRGLLALSTSNVWIVHVDSPCGQSTWTSAGDHHLRWLNLQEKVGRGTLDLELSLDSYSGAPRGPRASPGPHLGLQRNVTNLLAQGSTLGRGSYTLGWGQPYVGEGQLYVEHRGTEVWR